MRLLFNFRVATEIVAGDLWPAYTATQSQPGSCSLVAAYRLTTPLMRRAMNLACIRRIGLIALAPAILIVLGGEASAIVVYVTDAGGIKRYDSDANDLDTLVPESGAAFSYTGLTVGPNGNLFAAATSPAPQIWEYNATTGAQVGPGPFVDYEGTPPTPDPDDVIDPQGLGFSHLNGNLYVADISGSTANVHVYDSAGASVGALSDAALNQPGDVAFDAAGNMYVSNPGFANVMWSLGGTAPLAELFSIAENGGLTNPTSLTVGPDGRLYVLDVSLDAILRYDIDGENPIVFYQPAAIDLLDLAFGPDDKLYVAGFDFVQGSDVLRRVTIAGLDDGALLTTGLLNPRFIAFAPVPELGAACLVGGGAGTAIVVGFLRRKRRARSVRAA